MATKRYLDQAGLQRVWGKIKERDEAITQVYGYYLNGKFYTDSTYTVEIPSTNKRIYINMNAEAEGQGTGIYYWDGSIYKRCVQEATDVVPGILKLFNGPGQNENGTMSQKSITDGVNAIKFAVDTTEAECLVLDLPWD